MALVRDLPDIQSRAWTVRPGDEALPQSDTREVLFRRRSAAFPHGAEVFKMRVADFCAGERPAEAPKSLAPVTPLQTGEYLYAAAAAGDLDGVRCIMESRSPSYTRMWFRGAQYTEDDLHVMRAINAAVTADARDVVRYLVRATAPLDWEVALYVMGSAASHSARAAAVRAYVNV